MTPKPIISEKFVAKSVYIGVYFEKKTKKQIYIDGLFCDSHLSGLISLGAVRFIKMGFSTAPMISKNNPAQMCVYEAQTCVM
ncbi:hypothetical protein GO003_018935 [Methylicorpusculum oleiharenae]|uniref:hypothetical protein n=1 Tax=Methylicorpusculum oleiharenae TaxID=1338687 RepID=UPI00135C8F37|nr:hypothetical protein [Methylicorpusculum oleiharenae]MCD2452463.1 hypothetical protein [Methylicorpusculum oleiharenae]